MNDSASNDPTTDPAAAGDAATDAEPAKGGMATRFRGFLPVVVDVETGGFNAATDALLEIAAVTLQWLLVTQAILVVWQMTLAIRS